MNLYFLLFVALSTLTSLLLSLLNQSLNPTIALISIAVGLLFAVRGKVEPRKIGYFEYFVFGIFGIFCYYQFIYLYFSVGTHQLIGNSNNLGDLPFHINLIKSFARGIEFWPQNPEWSGAKLHYPFGMDLFNSLFETLNVQTKAHLFLAGMLGSFLLIRELYLWFGATALIAFFCSGGFWGWNEYLQGSGAFPGSEIQFKNLLLSVFVSQRGFLWALPMGIHLLRNFQKFESLEKKQIFWFSFCLGVSPIFHLHSAFVWFLYLSIACVFHPFRRQWIRILLQALLLAGPLTLALLSNGSVAGSALGPLYFWTFDPNSEKSLFVYILQNFLPIAILAPFLFVKILKRKNIFDWIPWGLFLLFVTVRFAYWSWDNIKCLIWVYLLIFASFSTHYLTKERPKYWKSFFAIAIAILMSPGFFQLKASLPGRAAHQSQLSRPGQFYDCRQPLFSVNDAVIAAPDYDHPLLFWGTKMVFGYEGHLWSHGIPSQIIAERKNRIRQLFIDLQSKQTFGFQQWQRAAKDLGAKWLYWSDSERSYFGIPAGSVEEKNLLNGLRFQPACLSQGQMGDQIGDGLYELF